MFVGDSLTSPQNGYVSKVRNRVSIPVINAGVNGAKSTDVLDYLDFLLMYDPTVVVVFIGLNDVLRFVIDDGTQVGDFAKAMFDIVEECQSSGARVILCTLSVLGEDKIWERNDVDKYSDVIRSVAWVEETQLIDIRSEIKRYLRVENKDNNTCGILTYDGGHFNEAGHLFIADLMLEGLLLGGEHESN